MDGRNYLEERYEYDSQNRLLVTSNSQNVTFYQCDKQGNTVSELTKHFLELNNQAIGKRLWHCCQ